MNDDSEKLGNVPDADAARAAKLSALNKLFADEDAGADFADAAAERPGDRIGNYKLIERVGEGGFGTVWRAEQIEPVRREVAMKVMKADADMRELIERFRAEMQAVALMSHPNIAQMFDGGVTPAGRSYFVMEYVTGMWITTFCDERKLGIEERLRLFCDVCSAVEHAHGKAILHRDLKPANILVSETGGRFMPKVIDFGVAKALGTQLTAKMPLSEPGMMIGTPLYMSPEQIGAMGGEPDMRSDVYALGVILYELLAGSTPLTGERLRTLQLPDIQEWLRNSKPESPSTRVEHIASAAQTEIAQRRKMDATRLRNGLRGE